MGLTHILSGQLNIRYNELGYIKNQPLKFILISDVDLKDSKWSISKNGNTIEESILKKSVVGKSEYTSKKYNHIISPSSQLETGSYTFTSNGKSVEFEVIEHLPSQQVENMILYLRTKRSGAEANYNHSPSHLGDSSCKIYTKRGANTNWQKTKEFVNMSGGWYDAGDYIKFTLTSAYTTYLLIKAYESNPELFENSSIMEEIKFGLTYLAKTLPRDETFIIQVGGYLDHTQGVRLPENDKLDSKREAYSALSTPQMGYTAAALAAGARLAKEIDINKQDAESYLHLSEKIYTIAKSSNQSAWWQGDGQDPTQFEIPNIGGTGWETFYADNSTEDNLSLAAIELFELTKKADYKKEAVSYSTKAGPGWWASWGNCNMYANNEISVHSGQAKQPLIEDLNNFYGKVFIKSNIYGRAHDVTWGTLSSMLIVANNSLIYDQNNKLNKFNRIYNNTYNYVYGLNNWGISFVADSSFKNSFKNSYSAIFKLQPEINHIGEVSPGPGDRTSHESLGFSYGKRWEDEFNTSTTVYYDEGNDYMTAETTITLMADMIYFLALIDKSSR